MLQDVAGGAGADAVADAGAAVGGAGERVLKTAASSGAEVRRALPVWQHLLCLEVQRLEVHLCQWEHLLQLHLDRDHLSVHHREDLLHVEAFHDPWKNRCKKFQLTDLSTT